MSQKLYLQHTGTPQRFNYDPKNSGRYRKGSGANPHQHGFDKIYEQDKLMREYVGVKINPDTGKPYTKTEFVKKILGMSTEEYRKGRSSMKLAREEYNLRRVKELKDKGYSQTYIANELGISTGSVSKLLNIGLSVKNQEIKSTADMLKAQVEKYGYIDVGEGVQRTLGITEETLKNAIQYLQDNDGYTKSVIKIDQLQAQQQGQKTKNVVLGPPSDQSEKEMRKYLYDHLNEIHMINDVVSEDLGLSFRGIDYFPKALDSKRIEIKYADENGYQPKDGVIEIRPGVADLWLGPNTSYSQVRINVDDKYYLKGMAVYSDDLPSGVDVRFNTNKSEGAPMSKVFKPLKREKTLENGDPDPDSPVDKKNPFGAAIMSEAKGGQYFYTDENGKKQQSLINKVNDEGSWSEWGRSFIPQFGSKQPRELIERQLNWEYDERLAELEDLKKITNPVVKVNLLNDFAMACDTNSADLRGHALSGQTQRVLLPNETLKTAFTKSGEELDETSTTYNEVFAPGYEDGKQVVLVRFPHNGPCEILKCTVNNRNKSCKEMVKQGGEKDVAIIHPRGAAKLSGADFDGDSVAVMPAEGIHVKKLLREMSGFDAKQEYPYREGIKLADDRIKGLEMGLVTNLIADMGQIGCTDEQLSRAIKYSQVAIDAKKHKLDWERAKKELRIEELYKEFTGNSKGGAVTFITRAKSVRKYDEIAPDTKIDPETGALIRRESGHTHKKWTRPDSENGDWTYSLEKNKTKMKRALMVDDAYDLVSNRALPYWQEEVYADFSNQMKQLARQARLEILATKPDSVNKAATKAYSEEVESLNKKLDKVKSQIQYERQAQRLATYELKAIESQNGRLDREERSKKQSQLLSSARKAVYPLGKKEKIEITEKEWEAIQANAISTTKLKDILRQADEDQVRSYATPKNPKGRKLSDARIRQLQHMKASGRYSSAELANIFDISEGTVKDYLSLSV